MFLFLILACQETEKYDSDDIFAPQDIFCDNFAEEANVFEVTEGGASGSNGRLEAQLIVDADNPRDKTIIGNATYILESIDVGGGERLGQASPLGEIQVTLGAGDWLIRIEGVTGCSNEMEFTIQAESTHALCLPVYCE